MDIALLMAGAKERGELEARVTKLVEDVLKAGENIFEVPFKKKTAFTVAQFCYAFICR